MFLVGFTGMLQLKAWLATAALVLVVVSGHRAVAVGTAAGSAGTPRLARTGAPVERRRRLRLSVPVAVHCVWSLGFVTSTPRVLAHSALGCAFYGAYAAKMLGLRLRGTPRWLIPVLGGTMFTSSSSSG